MISEYGSHTDSCNKLWLLAFKLCYVTSTLSGIFTPIIIIAIPFCEKNMPPFLGSLLPTWEECVVSECIFGHIFIFLMQAWGIMILSIVFCIVVFKIFVGLCFLSVPA